MPVPKSKQKKYSIIVASQTKRMESKGMSPGSANKRAKAMADKALKIGKRKAKGKK